MDSPFNAEQETRIARKMLASGSTRGMVDFHLRDIGLREHMRAEVIAAAAKSINYRARLKSAAIALAGIILIVVGGYLYNQCVIHRVPGAKFSATIMMTGLLTAGFGMYGVTQKRI